MLLYFRMTQKAFQLPFYCYSFFSFSSVFFGRTDKSFFLCFIWVWSISDLYRVPYVICLGMNNGGFKREHEEPYSSTIQGIISTAMSMATKLYRVVTYHEGLPSIKSHNPLITWSYEITWEAGSILSPLRQYLWLPNLAER